MCEKLHLCVKLHPCVKLHIVCKITHCVSNYTLFKTTHFGICVKLHTFCKTEHFLSRIHWKILHLTEHFYTTSGCDGCDKYEVWLKIKILLQDQCNSEQQTDTE